MKVKLVRGRGSGTFSLTMARAPAGKFGSNATGTFTSISKLQWYSHSPSSGEGSFKMLPLLRPSKTRCAAQSLRANTKNNGWVRPTCFWPKVMFRMCSKGLPIFPQQLGRSFHGPGNLHRRLCQSFRTLREVLPQRKCMSSVGDSARLGLLREPGSDTSPRWRTRIHQWAGCATPRT